MKGYRKRKHPAKLTDSSDSRNFVTHVGMLVDVLWTEKDFEGTNWDPGWYREEVQQYDENDDTIVVFYRKDRVVYILNVTGAFAYGIIHLVTGKLLKGCEKILLGECKRM